MLKTTAALTAAAIVAAALTGFPGLGREMTASAAPAVQVAPMSVCADRAWPYSHHCANNRVAMPNIRLVTTDRLN
jgi:hypothetical protein